MCVSHANGALIFGEDRHESLEVRGVASNPDAREAHALTSGREPVRSPSAPIDDEPMEALLAQSITYRIAVGPRAGREVFTLRSLPTGDEKRGRGPPHGPIAGHRLSGGARRGPAPRQ